MNELRVYYSFFYSNLRIILAGFVIGLLLALYSFFQLKTVYSSERLFRLDYSAENIGQVALETDEVVSYLRTDEFKTSLFSADVQSFSVFKPGPVSLKLILSSESPQSLMENEVKLSNYLMNRYKGQFIGESVAYSAGRFLLLMAEVLAGGIGGIFFAVVKKFVRTY